MTLVEGQRVVVVDASVAIPFLRAEPTWVGRWRGWLSSGDTLLAPQHFPLEVANGLMRGTDIRSADHVSTLMRVLFSAGFEVADRGLRGLEAALRLAEQHRLSVYDAAYLDLAIDVDGELATLDRDLIAAATAEGVDVVA